MKSGESPESSRSPTPERRRKYKDSSDNDDSDSLYKKKVLTPQKTIILQIEGDLIHLERERKENIEQETIRIKGDLHRVIGKGKFLDQKIHIVEGKGEGQVLKKNQGKKPKKKKRESRSRSPKRKYNEQNFIKPSQDKKKSSSSYSSSKSEREKKLKEMMENANWRDEKRKENVKRSIEENKKSTKEYEEYYDPDFIRKQLSKAAESGTVEKRLNANKHHIQKGSDIMNTNFARR
ncbi:unnamed protein product [Lepeophtheirus salmonis]|uniref:(salmon louse) hypothetical protein n=1 Tax=Lepeophtheirus salmonis TaxID=72036 RepID=A0A7R8CK71_LEPSM|nr:unnamed protein product [Lepeophtheirus salmonis]CAF2846821.1 unnamed protein product [Lepeophtheirus salmonis]